MKQRCMKSLKIANEIMSVLTHDHAYILKSELKFKRNETHFNFTLKPNRFNEEELRDFLEMLNLPRQSEMEEYYWSLLGENKSDDNILVVARMIDEATAHVEDDTLTIHIIRKNA
jgi:hypothetical protein